MLDKEVLRALTMFVKDTWDDGLFHLTSTGSIAADGIMLRDFLEDHDSLPCSLPVEEMVKWASSHDSSWLVYVLYTSGEVCGMVAIKDYLC